MLTRTRIELVMIGCAAAALAMAAFQAGRLTVDAAALSQRSAGTSIDSPKRSPHSEAVADRDYSHASVRLIATVPFSQLYDFLRAATREQLLAWARDLERMPRGPQQRAAVNAYYKSLVQVDHRAAIEAVVRAQNINMREIALEALTKAAPESIWGELAEALTKLPYPHRKNVREDIIWNWSEVDPPAAARFISTHPVEGEDYRLYSLLCSWGQTNPEEARDWVEAEPWRQTKDAFRALVTEWAETDRAAAVNYALANALHPIFADAINELAYGFVRTSENDATGLLLRLPPDQAKAVMQYVAHMTTAVILGLPDGYQKPPDAIAQWMITLPIELWNDALGPVAEEWLKHDTAAATQWFDHLSPDMRDTALASFCRTATSESTAQVLDLGPSISDRKLRDAALGQFARNLRETKEEALEAINDLDIRDSEKAYLRKVMAEERNDR